MNLVYVLLLYSYYIVVVYRPSSNVLLAYKVIHILYMVLFGFPACNLPIQ